MSNTAAESVAFALRTGDAAWIIRNHGVTDEDGKTFVQVPAAQVELIKFARADMLRYRFADCPRDMGNANVMCPAEWVPETAARFAGRYALDGKALFLSLVAAKGA